MSTPTPKTARRLDAIRGMAADGASDARIAIALGMTAGAVFKLRKRYGIASAWTPPARREHGLLSMYRHHGCRCRKCRKANATACAEMKARRIVRREDASFEHGVSGYTNWAFRCTVCCAANSLACAKYWRDVRKSRKAAAS